MGTQFLFMAQTKLHRRQLGKLRVDEIASSATPTPNIDNFDELHVTALAVNAVIAAPVGTPYNGQRLLIRIEDNAVARTLGHNAIYRAVGVTLPLTTVAGKVMYIGYKYNGNTTTWDAIAYALET